MTEYSPFAYSVEEFREEASELLARAEGVLAQLKQAPDMERINALFRIIHSLKGSAAYAGLGDVNDFAHLYENLLGDVRSGRCELTDEVVRVLIRARDFLDDVIYRPEFIGPVHISKENIRALEQLNLILSEERTAQVSDTGTLTPSSGVAPAEAEVAGSVYEMETASAPFPPAAQGLGYSLYPKMGHEEVIRFSVEKILSTIRSLMEDLSPSGRKALEKGVVRLDNIVRWAFADKADSIINPVEQMKELFLGEPGPETWAQFNELFSQVSASLGVELGLNGQDQIPSDNDGCVEIDVDRTDEGSKSTEIKGTPEKIRGASKDDIVKITLERHLDTLLILLGDKETDAYQLRRILSRLKDLNRWAFNDNGQVCSTIEIMEDLLKRPFDGAVRSEMTALNRTLKAALAGLGGIEVAGAVEVPREVPVINAAPAPLPERPTLRESFNRRPQPAAGASMRVRSEDIESLISAVGELAGIDRKEFERLQNLALQLRMVPVGELFGRFRKVVRDLSEELNKEMDVEIIGESVRLDKVIADRLNEPILHMVRNAASHGLETVDERTAAGKASVGTIRLSAIQEGGQVIIEVSDDGRGIDVEKVEELGLELGLINKVAGETLSEKKILDLIFSPGFSTMKGVDALSGRGVGMDVVKEVITSLQGSVVVHTQKGVGTSFRIRLPLTLAVIKAMVIELGELRLALPANFVDKVVNMSDTELKDGTFMEKGRAVLALPDENDVVPVISLADIFGLGKKTDSHCVLLVRDGTGQKAAVISDAAVGRQPLTVKPLDRFAENRFFSSAAVIDNDIVLMLNTPALMSA